MRSFCLIFFSIILIQGKTNAQKVTYKYRADRMAIFHNDSQVCPFQFTELCSFSDGLCWANKGELYGYIDSFGKELIPYIYHDVKSFVNGVAFVSLDSGFHFGLINNKGDSLSPFVYTETIAFKEGFAAVKGQYYWGLMKSNGELVIDTIFDYPPIYSQGDFIALSYKNKYGVLNSKGEKLHDFSYTYINQMGEAYIKDKKFWLNLK